jgi:hypothetical protein
LVLRRQAQPVAGDALMIIAPEGSRHQATPLVREICACAPALRLRRDEVSHASLAQRKFRPPFDATFFFGFVAALKQRWKKPEDFTGMDSRNASC